MELLTMLIVAGLSIFGKSLHDRLKNRPVLHNILELIFKRYNIPIEEQQVFRQLAGAPTLNPASKEQMIAEIFAAMPPPGSTARPATPPAV